MVNSLKSAMSTRITNILLYPNTERFCDNRVQDSTGRVGIVRKIVPWNSLRFPHNRSSGKMLTMKNRGKQAF